MQPTLLLLLCSVLAAPALAEAPRYSVTKLLAGPSSADAINDAGQVAGTVTDPATGARRAYLWQNGAYTLLDTPINSISAISADGRIAGAIANFDAENFQSAPASYANGVTAPVPPLGGVPVRGRLEGINSAGMVAGSQDINGLPMAYTSYNGVTTALGTLGGSHSFARGMNEAGMVVGSSKTAGGSTHAFLHNGAAMVDLGTLDRYGSATAHAVNDHGVAVGYSWISNVGRYRAALYQNGVASPLGDFDEYEHSLALDINNAGRVIGVGDHDDTFLYQDGVTYDLASLLPRVPGFRLTSVSSINDSGQIAGTACDGYSSSFCYGVLLSPVPEPAAGLMLLAGLGVLYRYRRAVRPV